MRSRWGAIANPHEAMIKFLTPSAPQVSPLRHDTGNRMKILINMFSIFYFWEHAQSLVKKTFENDMATEI